MRSLGINKAIKIGFYNYDQRLQQTTHMYIQSPASLVLRVTSRREKGGARGGESCARELLVMAQMLQDLVHSGKEKRLKQMTL